MSQLDVIRCWKDRCINGGKATGEGRAGKETEARVRVTQIGLCKASDLDSAGDFAT